MDTRRRERRVVRTTPGILAGAMAFLAGAVLVQALPVLPPRWLDAVWGCAALAGMGLCLRRRLPGWVLFVAILLGAFAWTAWRADLALGARLPHVLEKQDILVTGRVTDLPEPRQDSTRFDFDISNAHLGGLPVAVRGHVRLSWYATRGHAPPTIAPCSTWRLRVRMKRPHGLVNPGGMDFERSALQKGIVATGYVREDPANAMLDAGACVDGVRARIGGAIDAALPNDAHAARLLRALSVGDERALDEHDWQVVRPTGISHLIAISGFHVGLAAVFGALLVRLLWWLFPALALRLARPLAEATVAFPAALAYGALAGFGLPTTRTLLMIAVVAGWRLLRRGGGFGEGFGLALAAILVLDPLSVLSAGFWLSFAGVALLAWTLARDSGWRGHLKEIGFAPLLMTLALLPLTVWFFGQASLVGPIANLVAVPFVSFVSCRSISRRARCCSRGQRPARDCCTFARTSSTDCGGSWSTSPRGSPRCSTCHSRRSWRSPSRASAPCGCWRRGACRRAPSARCCCCPCAGRAPACRRPAPSAPPWSTWGRASRCWCAPVGMHCCSTPARAIPPALTWVPRRWCRACTASVSRTWTG
jgi:competence protein ComEC